MSDVESHKIVFVIDRVLEGSNIEVQKDNIKLAILKWICQFATPLASTGGISLGLQHVKWAYRFMDTPKNLSTVQDWKEVGMSQISSLENDMDGFFQVSNFGNSKGLSGGAHRLSEELMSIVHDYNWESLDLFSPVKPRKSKVSKSNQKLAKGHSSKIFEVAKLPKNMVVLFAPMPLSQEQLNEYFEWHVENVSYISSKLMPNHLSLHFCKKYNIALFWIDTNADLNPVKDTIGIVLMKKFLRRVGGDSVSLTMLCNEGSNNPATSTPSNEMPGNKNNIPSLPTSTLLYLMSRQKEHDTEKRRNHTVHICKVEPTDEDKKSFKIEKLWTVCLKEMNIGADILGILHTSCSSCSSSTKREHSIDHNVICSLESGVPCLIFPFFKKTNLSEVNEPETVFVIIGAMAQGDIIHVLESEEISGLTTVWCDMDMLNTYIDPSCDALKRTVMVAEIHKYCTQCGGEPSLRGRSRYVLLQLVTTKLMQVTFISSHSANILNYVQIHSTNVDGTQPCFDNWNVYDNQQMQSPRQNSTLSVFEPSVFDVCYPYMRTSNRNLEELFTSGDMRLPNSDRKEKIEKYSVLIKKLQELYREKTPVKEEPKTSVSVVNHETHPDEILPLSAQEQYQNAVSLVPDSVSQDDWSSCYIKFFHAAQSIICLVTQNYKGGKSKEEMKSSCFITPVKEIKEAKNCSLSVMQVLLRMEFAKSLSPADDCIELAEEISSILRLIALATSQPAMRILLGQTLVDNYADGCGRLLCEVHNELMQPIPSSLEVYHSKDDIDISSDVLSVPSIYGNTSSVYGSVRSSRSCGGNESSNRNPRFGGVSSLKLGRQIEMPGQKKAQDKTAMSCHSEDGIKSRLRSSAKKAQTSSDTDATKVRNIKRDLFSDMSKETMRSDQVFSSPARNKHQKLTVSDTPNVKQRMTALCRQRLRLRKEKDVATGNLSVIEESPAKVEDNCSTAVIPNRVAKLTRRHSFYCSGTESRTVSRAKIIHQHQQAVPPTPDVTAKQKIRKSTVASEVEETILQEPSTSSLKQLSSRRAMKSLFQSPVRSKSRSVLIENQVDNTSLCDGMEAKIETNAFASPKKSKQCSFSQETSTEKLCVKPQSSCSDYGVSIEDNSGFIPLKYSIKNNKFESKASATSADETSGRAANSQLLLDSFVIRSCSSAPHVQDKSECVKKRKSSQDNTPTRDDINKWPRKKRGVDNSSPGIVAKKRKKLFDTSNLDGLMATRMQTRSTP